MKLSLRWSKIPSFFFAVKHHRCASSGGEMNAGWFNQALPQFLTHTACHVKVTVVRSSFCDVISIAGSC